MAGAAGWGIAAQAVTDIAENALGAVFAQHSAKKAYQRQKTILKNRIRWASEDMRRAGINPILAGGAPQAGSASVAQAQRGGGGRSNIGATIMNSARISSDLETAEELRKATRQQVSESIDRSTQHRAEANKADFERLVLGPQRAGLLRSEEQLNTAMQAYRQQETKNLILAQPRLQAEGAYFRGDTDIPALRYGYQVSQSAAKQVGFENISGKPTGLTFRPWVHRVGDYFRAPSPPRSGGNYSGR